MTKPPQVLMLMPDITPMEDEFVENFIETGNVIAAATAAGYSQPGIQGRAIARRPKVVAAIRIATAKRMQGMVPVALTVLGQIMVDKNAPAGARVDAAKTILDRSGYGSNADLIKRADDMRPLAEYSMQELEELVRKLEAQKGAEAIDVTPDSEGNAPLSRADHAQVIDPLE